MYRNKLVAMNVAETRIDDILVGMDKLHSALCKLDLSNLRSFLRMPLDAHMDTYARMEGTANPIKTWKEMRIRATVDRIDHEEFDMRQYSDKLNDMLEDMREVNMPGVHYFTDMLADTRKAFEVAHPDVSNLLDETTPSIGSYQTLTAGAVIKLKELISQYEEGLTCAYEFAVCAAQVTEALTQMSSTHHCEYEILPSCPETGCKCQPKP